MKTVRLITCNDAVQAHILQGALENEGIDSLLHNENFSSLLKSYVSNISDNHWTYECRQCKAFFERTVSATYKKDEES